MKITIKLEEFAMLFLGIYAFINLQIEWWWFPVLFLLPDVSMLGYLFGNKWGAFFYNLFHHKGFAIGIYLTGLLLSTPELQLIGIILFSHSSFDRLLGYGLKYSNGFKSTHLGPIGNSNNKGFDRQLF